MTEEEKLVIFQKWKRENVFRHGQRGYYSLADLPQRPPIAQSALSTGWWELDQIFRLYPGQFVVMTGLPGSGKSTLMLNIVANLARKGHVSFLYVPENEQNLEAKMRGIWNDDRTFREFCRTCCFVQSAEVDDGERHTLQWVLAQAMVAVRRDKAKLVMIDPWNELERCKPADLLMTDYITECLMMLKDFCRSTAVSVVVLAHPTKAVNERAGRIPTLGDIEGSMAWFNKCDNGLIVAREDRTTRVISAKVREKDAGRIGQCYLRFDPKTEIFYPDNSGAVSL